MPGCPRLPSVRGMDTHTVTGRPGIGTAASIAADIRAGRRTARAVIDDCLARIGAADPRLGAFVAVTADAARAAADALDARPDRAGLPLAGVPVVVKDNIAVAGLPTRHG